MFSNNFLNNSSDVNQQVIPNPAQFAAPKPTDYNSAAGCGGPSGPMIATNGFGLVPVGTYGGQPDVAQPGMMQQGMMQQGMVPPQTNVANNMVTKQVSDPATRSPSDMCIQWDPKRVHFSGQPPMNASVAASVSNLTTGVNTVIPSMSNLSVGDPAGSQMATATQPKFQPRKSSIKPHVIPAGGVIDKDQKTFSIQAKDILNSDYDVASKDAIHPKISGAIQQALATYQQNSVAAPDMATLTRQTPIELTPEILVYVLTLLLNCTNSPLSELQADILETLANEPNRVIVMKELDFMAPQVMISTLYINAIYTLIGQASTWNPMDAPFRYFVWCGGIESSHYINRTLNTAVGPPLRLVLTY